MLAVVLNIGTSETSLYNPIIQAVLLYHGMEDADPGWNCKQYNSDLDLHCFTSPRSSDIKEYPVCICSGLVAKKLDSLQI